MPTHALESPVDHAFLEDKLERLTRAAETRGVTPLLTIAQSVHPEPVTRWHAATLTDSYAIANCEATDASAASSLCEAATGHGVTVLLDASQKSPRSQEWRELLDPAAARHAYSDLQVWAEAIVGLLVPLFPPSPMREVALIGASPLTDALVARCGQLGYDIARGHAIVGAEPGPLALIGTAFHRPVIDRTMLDAVRSDGAEPLCIDGGIGTFAPKALEFARSQGWRVLRPDMRAALAAEVERVLQYTRLVTEYLGTREIAGVRCVAGGVIGEAGLVVLDRIDHPTEVLGWADGCGGLVTETDDAAWVEARKRVEGAL